jgi:hypothetical protein
MPENSDSAHEPVAPGPRSWVVPCSDSCRTIPLLRAHRNLLLPMLQQARFALAELSVYEPARRRVDLLARAAARAEELAHREIGGAVLATSFTVCDVSNIAREVVQLFAGTLPGDVPVVQVARATSPLVLGDELLLYQLLVEVLAVAATRVGGAAGVEIRVEIDSGGPVVAPEQPQVRLSVRIAPVGEATLASVPMPSSIYDPARLDMVRDLVAFHGGRLSEIAGSGVRLHLPAAYEPMPTDPGSLRLGIGVEDGSAAMAHVDACLRRSGRDVITATHAGSAAALVAAHAASGCFLFAMADRASAPGLAWLQGMARTWPQLLCFLVVPDGLQAAELLPPDSSSLLVTPIRQLETMLASCAARAH